MCFRRFLLATYRSRVLCDGLKVKRSGRKQSIENARRNQSATLRPETQ